MQQLQKHESQSIYIIRETFFEYEKPAMLWSMGKDSTMLLHLVRKAFFGKIPFPILHIDTGKKFNEIYSFRDKLARDWNLDLKIIESPIVNDKEQFPLYPKDGKKLECCHQLKTQPLIDYLAKENHDAILLGIRRDEHGIRAKERYFSFRNDQNQWAPTHQQPELWNYYRSEVNRDEHVRVHPILHYSEQDIWDYTLLHKLPICPLYLSQSGKRYRSIGCECCCNPIQSEADTIEAIADELRQTNTNERDGRSQDKEDMYAMQKLRSLGYM